MARLSNINSCLLTAKYDWTSSTTSNQETSPTQVFYYQPTRLALVNNDESLYPYNVIETKTKIRGKGKALVLRFESEEGKDFELLGWGLPFEAKTRE